MCEVFWALRVLKWSISVNSSKVNVPFVVWRTSRLNLGHCLRKHYRFSSFSINQLSQLKESRFQQCVISIELREVNLSPDSFVFSHSWLKVRENALEDNQSKWSIFLTNWRTTVFAWSCHQQLIIIMSNNAYVCLFPSYIFEGKKNNSICFIQMTNRR